MITLESLEKMKERPVLKHKEKKLLIALNKKPRKVKQSKLSPIKQSTLNKVLGALSSNPLTKVELKTGEGISMSALDKAITHMLNDNSIKRTFLCFTGLKRRYLFTAA